jgi:cyclophilin family peptidyl-prolyl cis-trans isomerase
MTLLTRCVSFLLISLLALTATTPAQAVSSRSQVLLQTTKGDIVIDLYPDQAPETVKNFLRLVDSGFYTDLIFHRVIPDFMIQAGGYDRRLNYREAPRQVPNESDNVLKNLNGFVAMARKNDPDSAGSQFYINVRSNPTLDAQPGRPGYTVFGRVVSGMDVVSEIENTPTQQQNGMADVPIEPVIITGAKRL